MAIMRPRITPRPIAAVPVRPDSQELRPVVIAAMGPPSSRNIRPEAMIEASSGMMTTGMRLRSHLGTAIRPIMRAT